MCYIFNADNPFKVIEEQLKAEKTDLVIIDAYSDIFEGNSNDLGNVRKFLNRFEKLAQENDCAIIFLHHTGKRTELGSPSKNNIIGSQGFEAKMRIVWDLRKMEGNPNRFFQVTKGNYLPESQKSKSMELLFNSKQEFEFTGQFVDRNNSQSKLKFTEEEKTAIMKEVERMLADKLPYVTILTELKKLGFENTPSIGTLSNWIKEKKVVHSDENIEK